MFNQQKKGGASPGRKEHPKDYAVTIITSGCHFSGKLYCKGSTRIGGKVDGEIISEGLLIIEEEAVISATVKAEDIVIQGQLRGIVEAHGKVELSPSCVYEGDIITPVLVIQEGAQFNGRTTMNASRIIDRQNSQEMAQVFPAPYLGSAMNATEVQSVEFSRTDPEINAQI